MNSWLVHSRGGHKYIMKIGSGKKAKYFYTQAEIDAYRRMANTAKEEIKGAKRAINAIRGKGNNFYDADGKGYRKATFDKKNPKRIEKFSNKVYRTKRIERGILAVHRLLNPDQ